MRRRGPGPPNLRHGYPRAPRDGTHGWVPLRPVRPGPGRRRGSGAPGRNPTGTAPTTTGRHVARGRGGGGSGGPRRTWVAGFRCSTAAADVCIAPAWPCRGVDAVPGGGPRGDRPFAQSSPLFLFFLTKNHERCTPILGILLKRSHEKHNAHLSSFEYTIAVWLIFPPFSLAQ